MADYRLDCCGGFPTHEDGCVASAQQRVARRERARVHAEEPAKRKVMGSVTSAVSVRRPTDGYEISFGTGFGDADGHTVDTVARALKDITGDEWTVRIEHTTTEEYVP